MQKLHKRILFTILCITTTQAYSKNFFEYILGWVINSYTTKSDQKIESKNLTDNLLEELFSDALDYNIPYQPNEQVNVDCSLSQLHRATYQGDIERVQQLINDNADVNLQAQDCRFITPLHIAALKGHTEIARLLIENGAKVNITNPKGLKDPIRLSASRGHPETTELLIKNGAGYHLQSFNEESIYDLAKSEAHPRVVDVFSRFEALEDLDKELELLFNIRHESPYDKLLLSINKNIPDEDKMLLAKAAIARGWIQIADAIIKSKILLLSLEEEPDVIQQLKNATKGLPPRQY